MDNRKEHIRSVVGRAKWIYIVFAIAFGGIIIKALWIELGPRSEALSQQGATANFHYASLPATRGDILSDDGRTLLTSVQYYEIRMDMRARGLKDTTFSNNIAALSDSLSALFRDKSSSQYRAELTRAYKEGKSYYLVNKNKVTHLEKKRLERFPIFRYGANRGGLITVASIRRERPYGNIAYRSIGFLNPTGNNTGLEGRFDSLLRGTDGVTLMQKVSARKWQPTTSPSNVDPINGYNVVSTINIELQEYVQAQLSARLRDTEGDWGTVIVMETATGHVKAIANSTRTASGKIAEEIYNYAIGRRLEPGSTFKIATVIALLDDAHMSPHEMLATGHGRMKIGEVTVTDDGANGHGTVDLVEAFAVSSNIGMAMGVNKYYGKNPTKFSAELARLGLNTPLDIQIPTGTKPYIKDPSMKGAWHGKGVSLTRMSYGYENEITPIQTLTLANAVANGGRMIVPLFVTQLRSGNDTVTEFKAEVLNAAICSPTTLRTMQQAMENVVTHGTAKALRNPDYRVAAKTGTAQVANDNRGYRLNDGMNYFGSLVGYFPADNPQYTIIVGIQTFRPDGSKKPYHGAALCAPLFKSISDHIFATDRRFASPVKPRGTTLDMPLEVKTGDDAELQQLLKTLKVKPTKDFIIMSDATQRSIRDNAPDMNRDSISKPVRKPLDVRGYTLGKAIETLERKGFRVVSTGRGVVVRQKIDSVEKEVTIHLQ